MNKGKKACTNERQEFESWPDENRPTFPDSVLNIVIHVVRLLGGMHTMELFKILNISAKSKPNLEIF